MPEMDIPRVVQDIANLRMQVNALEVATKNETLPATLKDTRSTIRWSAAAIALALIISSVLRYCGDSRVEQLEQRVEQLEKYHTTPPGT